MTLPGALAFDLLMAVMNSVEVWSAAAGDRAVGLCWRDAVTDHISSAGRYIPYEDVVAEAAEVVGLPPTARAQLMQRWSRMEPWRDAAAINRLRVPYAFVTNASRTLADVAARRSGLRPAFVLSAEEAGWYKPHPAIYQAACRRLGLEPTDVLFVAGSPYDARGAADAGLQAAFVRRRPDHPAPGSTVRALASFHDLAEYGFDMRR